jgi:uncharacterized hydrophobic protein (TIGR00271 family)
MEKAKISVNSLNTSFSKLESRAKYDLDNIFLTMMASIICAFGFRMNSPSVILGSMVIAPLLFPVVGFGAAIYLRKPKSIIKNLTSIFIGTLIAILFSFIVNLFFPSIQGTEITTRLAAHPLDYFMVALFSGMAGTFAFFWPDIISAIVGIGVSVALVPPMVMIGIGLADSNTDLTNSSVNIVLINILGILLGSYICVLALNIYARRFNNLENNVN